MVRCDTCLLDRILGDSAVVLPLITYNCADRSVKLRHKRYRQARAEVEEVCFDETLLLVISSLPILHTARFSVDGVVLAV